MSTRDRRRFLRSFALVAALAAPVAAQTHVYPWRGGGPVAALPRGWCTDTHRERVVAVADGDTWEYDGRHWLPRNGDAPAPGVGGAMAYDPARRRSVFRDEHEVREWDGSRWTIAWQRGLQPGPTMVGAAMAWDAASQRIVLFGGDSVVGQTWSFDGTAWTRLLPAHAPAGRHHHAMTHDPLRGRIVLHGGRSFASPPRCLADTWLWNGIDWQLLPTAGGPACSHTAMAWSPDAQVVVQYGGLDDLGRVLELHHAWNGSTWSQMVQLEPPPARHSALLATVPTRGKAMLFGGARDAQGSRKWTDRWLLGSTTPLHWVQETEDVVPGSAVLAFDPSERVTLAVTFDPPQTWRWNGSVWQLLGAAPGASSALAPSPGGQMMLGVDDNGRMQTYVWNRVHWQGSGPGLAPPATSPVIAYDSWRNVTLMLSVEPGDARVWEWNGTTWRDATAPGAPPEGRSSAAFDEVRGRLVVLGSAATHEWDGTSWTTVAAHPGRGGPLVWLPTVQRVVLCWDPLYAWDGATWTPQPGSARGSARDPFDRLIELDTSGTSGTAPTRTWLTDFAVHGQQGTLGSPCAIAGHTPRIAASAPLVGMPFASEVQDAVPDALCAVCFDATQVSVPLVGPCRLYLAQPTLLGIAVANAGGFASVTDFVPRTPWSRGVQLYLQGAVLDPAGGGFATTNAMRVLFGDW
jgi:hypothetical protein